MRLIDADALLARIMKDAPGFSDGGSEVTKAFIMAMITTKSVTPTVDAVMVIRCKDCKHGKRIINTIGDPCVVCENDELGMECNRLPEDWFCADGERR